MTFEIKKSINSRKERLFFLFEPLVSNQILIVLAGIILALSLLDQIVLSALITWLVLLLISVIYRLILKYKFDSHGELVIAEIPKWENKYLFGVFLSAVVWGSAGILLFAKNSLDHQILLELTIVVVCIVALRVLSPMKRGVLVFLPIVIIPLVVNIGLTGSQVGLPIAGLAAVYLAVSFISGLRLNRNFNENQRLRFEATEREKKLLESEEKYRLLYEKSEDPMMIISGDDIVMVNQATVDMFGYENEQQILTVSPFVFTTERQADGELSTEHVKRIKAIVYKRGYCRFEWLYKKRDGEVHPADVTLTSIPYEGNKAVFCILRDITESKETEKKLIVAQQKADSANKAKSMFLANMSHEIRTPMNGILGTTDLLLQNPLSEGQTFRAETIKKSAVSLLSIINDILDISKIEAGKLDLDIREFGIFELIQEFSSSIYSTVKAKNIDFQCDINNQKNHWYKGDSGRIVQILNNLVGNAIKFTDEGGITLDYEVTEENEMEAILKFNVKDTGIGLDKKQQRELFNRFTQGDETTTRKYGGTGLGLNISQQLASLMGGEIGVTSEIEQGSHFWFTVKLQKSSTKVSGYNQLPPKQKSMKQYNALALVVDDNLTNQFVAKGVLESFGLEVDLAINGQVAIESVQSKQYDLVFMDCQMPIMDGYEATKTIRNQNLDINSNQEISIIAMTASAMPGDRENCIAAGMNDYVTKPIEIKIVAQILETWLPDEKKVADREVNLPEIEPIENTFLNATLLFDYPALYERLAGDTDLLKIIAGKFIKSIGTHIEKIDVALIENNFRNIAKTAHTLVGSAATVGCMQLSTLATDIEMAGQKNDRQAVKILIPLLKPCYKKTKQAVEAQLSELL